MIFLLKGKRNGFFVEFGAANGHDLSNTAVLERDFQWKGILAEPAKGWHAALKQNRTAAIDTRCVWSQSGVTLDFKETKLAEYSTLASLAAGDIHGELRVEGQHYPVVTVEHNFREPDRQNIADLLTSKGFMRVFQELSQFDDWYVARSVLGM